MASNSIGMELSPIPAGEFEMGSPESDEDAQNEEKPQHRVRITQPFYLGVHPVTVGQFRRFVEATGYQTDAEKDGEGGLGWDAAANGWRENPKFNWRSSGRDETDDHPVVNVTWFDATAFSDWLSAQEGQKYRLPTEAEWEYACRAGTTTRYSFGDEPEALGQYAWYVVNSNRRTHPVGEKKPNGFGLYDMHGHVWEWCYDWFDPFYYKRSPVDDPCGPFRRWCSVWYDQSSREWCYDWDNEEDYELPPDEDPDPRGPICAPHRVFRGGGWHNDPRLERSAYRSAYTPERRHHDLGFRLARARSGG
jgi:formylglycine-generating enzyme required for sulfatase activity